MCRVVFLPKLIITEESRDRQYGTTVDADPSVVPKAEASNVNA
jgi:hypothetical protein